MRFFYSNYSITVVQAYDTWLELTNPFCLGSFLLTRLGTKIRNSDNKRLRTKTRTTSWQTNRLELELAVELHINSLEVELKLELYKLIT